jgi:hypothetical protein
MQIHIEKDLRDVGAVQEFLQFVGCHVLSFDRLGRPSIDCGDGLHTSQVVSAIAEQQFCSQFCPSYLFPVTLASRQFFAFDGAEAAFDFFRR